MVTGPVCIIPARMASIRFPGKPLAPLLGMALVLHVWHRCCLCDGFERVVIATCDEEIHAAAAAAGADVIMTLASHERATDRTSEAVANMELGLADDDLVVMVQGDEVLMSPAIIDAVIETYENGGSPVINLASRLYRIEDYVDPNVVKVIAARDGRALYFSRAPLPSGAVHDRQLPMYQQTGVMGFSAAFLHRFGRMEQTWLEKTESVDMLRVLENGINLQLVFTDTETIGVDTPADLTRAEGMLADDLFTTHYLQGAA